MNTKVVFVVQSRSNPIQQPVVGVFDTSEGAAAFIGKWPPHARFGVTEVELNVESVSLVQFTAPEKPEPEEPPAA